MSARKIIQIATAVHGMATELYALCEDGTVLMMKYSERGKGKYWQELIKPPEEFKS